MPIQPTDLISGQDFTALSDITASQMNQAVDEAVLQSDRGIIIESTDSAAGVPVVPNGDTTLAWKRYDWKRLPHASQSTYPPKRYVWNPNASSDVTLKKWQLLVPKRVFDPCDYGADPENVIASDHAIRRAIFAAAAVKGVVKFRDGIYALDGNKDYASDESVPFYNDYEHDSGYWYPFVVPVMDDVVITSEGHAVIKSPLHAPGLGIGMLFGSIGYNNVIIENLKFDGRCDEQPTYFTALNVAAQATMLAEGFPSGTYDVYTGSMFRAIEMGNKSIARFNHIYNMGGSAPIPTDVAYSALINRANQAGTSLLEIYHISCANECEVYGNIIERNWGGGVLLHGCFNHVHDNIMRDCAQAGVNHYISKSGSMAAITQSYVLLDIMLATKYQKAYRNRDLGTLNSIVSGYFGGAAGWETDLTKLYDKATLLALSGDNLRSASRYFCLFNRTENNQFIRNGFAGVYCENSLGTSIEHNQFVQGIPDLPKCGVDFPVPLTDGKYYTFSGVGGIVMASIAGEMYIRNNEFISDGSELNTATDGSTKSLWYPISQDALSTVVDSDSTTPTQEQAIPIMGIIENNYLIGNNTGASTIGQSDVDHQYPLLNLTSCADGNLADNIVLPITEYVLNSPLGPDPQRVNPFLAFQGKARFVNPQGASAQESAWFNTTKRQQFRFLPLRKDVNWDISYELAVRNLTDLSIYSKQSGKIKFRYNSSAVQLIDHEITEINYQSGSFEIAATYNELLPDNLFPGGRTITTMYRGGLIFYFNAWDASQWSYQPSGASLINSNLVFDFAAEIKEI